MMNGYQGQQPAFSEMQPMQQRVNPVNAGGVGMMGAQPPQQNWSAGMQQVANALRMKQMQGMQPGMQQGMMPPATAQSPMASIFGPSQSAPVMGTGSMY
jgi:hypothetical protein